MLDRPVPGAEQPGRASSSADDVEPTHILLTHGHSDHIADAVAVAKRTGAHCVAITELAGWLGEQGVEETSDPNLGGTVEFDWGRVKLVQALHTNTTPDGTAIGAGRGAGDQDRRHDRLPPRRHGLFGDLKLIAERHSLDVALVPIGGHFTMDRHDAAFACGLIGAATVIPCHYNTFPPIETDAEAFKAEVESETALRGSCCWSPGDTYEVGAPGAGD